MKLPARRWQARRESNPQPAVLETAALPIELLACGISVLDIHPLILICNPIKGNKIIEKTKPRPQLKPRLSDSSAHYSMILATTPAPTVRPPSRIAKRRPSSIAIGAINSTTILMLSPGITISTPSGRVTAPVTSVVRK
jgi:hypothetical protein